ncbi:metal-dependent hydrolase [Salipaludibacillus daqingensis]|uniref:metal-dependent hydrolase n=1 Tax=Salipaludibacillus daqingensis TaxID=3041001 RepID=UPI002476C0BB|nr:metal-dependent hydrolase [Salipaludibacillus daqingensis]
MRYYTHITTSISSVILLSDWLPPQVSITSSIVLSGIILGSVLPDLDESRSWIGRRIPILSTMISLVFGHRSITHSGIMLALMTTAFLHFSHEFLLGLFLGVALHIIADFFSVGGIPLFYPFSKKRSQVGLYRTGKWSEGLFFISGLAFIMYYLL